MKNLLQNFWNWTQDGSPITDKEFYAGLLIFAIAIGVSFLGCMMGRKDKENDDISNIKIKYK